MKIRKATQTDLEQIANLFDQYRIFYKKASNLAQARLFLAERIKNDDSQLFVSENENGLVVGFVQLYPIFSSTRMKKLWLLNDLFVEKAFRGQGISIKLIEKAKELCILSGSCGMILETSKTNIEGNQLYPKTSFELDSEHNYYSWDC